MSRRAGFTVIEALAVLLLLLLTLELGWTLCTGMARAAAELADRAESLAASRATGWILQEELDGARASADVTRPAADSVSLRAFRGAAVTCAVGSTDLLVAWSGIRTPDPAKDSVLVLTGSGAATPHALVRRVPAAGGCPEGTGRSPERWTLEPPAADALLLRVFERGSHHLADDALRYRIGQGGRQPLTPPSLDPAQSGLVAVGSSGLALELTARGARRGGRGPTVRRVFRLDGRW